MLHHRINPVAGWTQAARLGLTDVLLAALYLESLHPIAARREGARLSVPDAATSRAEKKCEGGADPMHDAVVLRTPPQCLVQSFFALRSSLMRTSSLMRSSGMPG